MEQNVLGTLHVAKNLTNSLFVAKSMDLLLASHFCKDIRIHNFMLEGDILQVVNLLKLNSQDWSEGALLV